MKKVKLFSVLVLIVISIGSFGLYNLNQVQAEATKAVNPVSFKISWVKTPGTLKVGSINNFIFTVSTPTPKSVLSYGACILNSWYKPLGEQSHGALDDSTFPGDNQKPLGNSTVTDGAHTYHVRVDYGAAGMSGLFNQKVSLPATYSLALTNSDQVRNRVKKYGKLSVHYSITCRTPAGNYFNSAEKIVVVIP